MFTQSKALADQMVSMAVTLGPIVLFTLVFFGPGVVLFILGTYFGRLFMPPRISVKREMSNTRAPVLGFPKPQVDFGTAVEGLVSIRTYECQQAFSKESLQRLDRYTRTARLSFDLMPPGPGGTRLRTQMGIGNHQGGTLGRDFGIRVWNTSIKAVSMSSATMSTKPSPKIMKIIYIDTILAARGPPLVPAAGRGGRTSMTLPDGGDVYP
ncbi:hypothetical protein B0H11DRAFT_1932336 [Mycena galericulata]|nr:hypothetical protein B0H11DRAFT_1932336 [Mycena galericulata]